MESEVVEWWPVYLLLGLVFILVNLKYVQKEYFPASNLLNVIRWLLSVAGLLLLATTSNEPFLSFFGYIAAIFGFFYGGLQVLLEWEEQTK